VNSWTALHASKFAFLITTLRGPNAQKTRFRLCCLRLLELPRDRHLASLLVRWLLPRTDHIEDILSDIFACWNMCIRNRCLAMRHNKFLTSHKITCSQYGLLDCDIMYSRELGHNLSEYTCHLLSHFPH
jgi:hypothetical protein